MSAVARFAAEGGLVLGICNGFQMLCEAGLLPGVLMRNNHLQFRCQWTNLRVEQTETPFTNACAPRRILRIPISHGEGSYYADAPTLDRLESNGQVLFRYCDPAGEPTPASNPNGSLNNIAGITNEQGNVLGMMPHPERCCEQIMGGVDGLPVFNSIINALSAKMTTPHLILRSPAFSPLPSWRPLHNRHSRENGNPGVGLFRCECVASLTECWGEERVTQKSPSWERVGVRASPYPHVILSEAKNLQRGAQSSPMHSPIPTINPLRNK